MVSAVPAAPSPTCHITADVKNITLQPSSSCNFPTKRTLSAYYLLQSKIKSVSAIQTDEKFGITCDQLYLVNKEVSIRTYDDSRDYSKIKAIEGEINFAGDECTSGIFLKDYNPPALKENISTETAVKKTIFQKIASWFKGLFK